MFIKGDFSALDDKDNDEIVDSEINIIKTPPDEINN